jgi:protein-S-isoprenylcysteine O-methyltransferase Ste14
LVVAIAICGIKATLRFVPLAGIMSVLLIGVIWRALLQRRRYGTSGIAWFDLSEPSQLARAGGFILFFAGLGVQAFDAARNPPGVHAATWLPPQGALLLSSTGAIVLVGGLVLLVTAQLQMGASWRIGIDEDAAPGLIDTGLFRFCRNPIYLALLVIIAGYVAMLPTPISLLMWVGAYLSVRLQIRAEEAYLRRSYGEAYRAYVRRVGRLLPYLGRL